MGFRFKKSFKIAPGVKLNLNKKSAGITLGGKGAHYTVNTKGKKTSSVGIPGTGLYYQSSKTSGKSKAVKPNTSNNKNGCMSLFVLFLAIAFFPLGLYIIWKHTKWNKNVKIIASSVLILFWIFAVIVGMTTEPTEPTQQDFDTVETTTAQETTTQETTEQTTEQSTTSPKPVEKKTEKQETTIKTSGKTVYITPYGKKYHFDPDCAGENGFSISLEEAKKLNEACEKCVD